MELGGARVIAIDDQETDLQGIVRALHLRGVGVLPFHYQGSDSLRRCEPGVRIVFSDINVAPSAAPPHAQHVALAAIFDAVLHEANGPWVLVAWTASPTQIEDLHAELQKALGPDRAPLASFALGKSGFTNAQGEFDIEAVAEAVRTQLQADPVAAAIMDLEARASDAAHDVIRSLLELAGEAGAPSIADLLKSLSVAADGSSPPRPENVFETVGPALQDRLIRRGVAAPERAIWNAAFARATGAALSDSQRARLNSTLHLDPGGRAGERGAVSIIPADLGGALKRALRTAPEGLVFEHYLKRDKALKSLKAAKKKANPQAAVPNDAMLEAEFRSQLQWCLVEAAAACDASNAKRGLRRAIVALAVPTSLGEQALVGEHCWQSPLLFLGDRTVHLVTTARVTLSPVPKALASLQPSGRLREPLLDGLLQQVAGSQSRLGWIYF